MTVRAAHRAAQVATDPANREKDDFYPTPPEGTRALLAVERFAGAVWEPACGDGAISRELAAAGYDVVSTDLVDRGFGTARVDFLMEGRALAPNICTNPPFKMTVPFMRHAVDLTADTAGAKVALLLRLAALEGAGRRAIFETTPLARVWVFSRRLTIYRAGMAPAGGGAKPSGGVVAFAWFVWEHGYQGPPVLGWV